MISNSAPLSFPALSCLLLPWRFFVLPFGVLRLFPPPYRASCVLPRRDPLSLYGDLFSCRAPVYFWNARCDFEFIEKYQLFERLIGEKMYLMCWIVLGMFNEFKLKRSHTSLIIFHKLNKKIFTKTVLRTIVSC